MLNICIAVDVARMAINMVTMVVVIARTALNMVAIVVEMARMAVIMIWTKHKHVSTEKTWIVDCIVVRLRCILIVTTYIVEIARMALNMVTTTMTERVVTAATTIDCSNSDGRSDKFALQQTTFAADLTTTTTNPRVPLKPFGVLSDLNADDQVLTGWKLCLCLNSIQR